MCFVVAQIGAAVLGSVAGSAQSDSTWRDHDRADLTHATKARGWLYFIRRSGWERAANDGTMREGAAGDGPVVVRVPLAPPR